MQIKEPGLRSVYLGGGTPSILSSNQVSTIVGAFKHTYGLMENCEITLEVNPEDVTVQQVAAYLEAGINRFSVGVQSLDDAVLKTVARRHSVHTAEACILTLAQQMGKHANISIDLMYGLPFQCVESWKRTLDRALALPVQHISLYGLQLEAGSPLERLNHTAPAHYPIPDDEIHLECYAYARNALPQKGFTFYEVSNAARAGFESQHNLAYWKQCNYVGFGPGAHGMLYPNRYTVPENLKLYQAFESVMELTRVHPVTPWEHLENHFIFGLRMSQGINWRDVAPWCTEATIPLDILKQYVHSLTRSFKALVVSPQGVHLLPEGVITMNEVLQRFIHLEDEIHTL